MKALLTLVAIGLLVVSILATISVPLVVIAWLGLAKSFIVLGLVMGATCCYGIAHFIFEEIL